MSDNIIKDICEDDVEYIGNNKFIFNDEVVDWKELLYETIETLDGEFETCVCPQLETIMEKKEESEIKYRTDIADMLVN